MRSSFLGVALFGLLLSVIAIPATAQKPQNLVGKVSERLGEEPDPVSLIRKSAAFAEKQPQLAGNVVATMNVVMGEDENNQQQVFSLKLAEPNRYAFESVKPEEGITVRSDGQDTITIIDEVQKYTIESTTGGLSDFVSTPFVRQIGNGLGGLALSLLDSESAEDVIESTTEGTYIGEDEINGKPTHHCRFNTGNVTWDGWFATGDAPLVVRVQPDLSAVAKNSPAAQKFDNFKFEVYFGFEDWNLEANFDTQAFSTIGPEDFEEVESFFQQQEEQPHVLLGQEAPSFELENLAGESINLTDHLGKDVVILDFWATWCPPCVAALPKINKVADSFAEKGVVFYAVNQQEELEQVQEFLEEKELAVPVALDVEGNVGNDYSIEGLPTSILIGKDGKVQVVHVGLSGDLEAKLTAELEALVSGKDLAGEKLAEFEAKQAKRKAKQKERAEKRKAQAASKAAADTKS